MEILKLKTNLNCQNCVAKVTPKLNALKEVSAWEVDTNHPDKVLTVKGADLNIATINKALKEAGFSLKAEDVLDTDDLKRYSL